MKRRYERYQEYMKAGNTAEYDGREWSVNIWKKKESSKWKD